MALSDLLGIRIRHVALVGAAAAALGCAEVGVEVNNSDLEPEHVEESLAATAVSLREVAPEELIESPSDGRAAPSERAASVSASGPASPGVMSTCVAASPRSSEELLGLLRDGAILVRTQDRGADYGRAQVTSVTDEHGTLETPIIPVAIDPTSQVGADREAAGIETVWLSDREHAVFWNVDGRRYDAQSGTGDSLAARGACWVVAIRANDGRWMIAHAFPVGDDGGVELSSGSVSLDRIRAGTQG